VPVGWGRALHEQKNLVCGQLGGRNWVHLLPCGIAAGVQDEKTVLWQMSGGASGRRGVFWTLLPFRPHTRASAVCVHTATANELRDAASELMICRLKASIFLTIYLKINFRNAYSAIGGQIACVPATPKSATTYGRRSTIGAPLQITANNTSRLFHYEVRISQ
jgi:hypothetical protein